MVDIPLDFELYWDKDYSLEKLPTSEYVLDPQFEIIGCALRTPDGKDHWVSGDVNHVRSELLRLVPDWSSVRVVAHNARLEAAVLEWRLGIVPGGYLCTMVGSRPHLLPYARTVSLAGLAEHLGIGKKGTFVHKTQGKHRTDFTAPELDLFGEYAVNDEQLSRGIGEYLTKILPAEEQEILDLTIKKFVRPKLRLNNATLVARLQDIQSRKEQLAGMLQTKHGAELTDIRSRPKFAALLKKHGVEPPQKLNKKGTATYAFAKDDIAFKELLMHPVEAVRELVAAKLALSSTLEESRTKRLIRLGELKDGWLPVPLVYYGAHPGRFSGDDEINLQNLPRVEYKDDVLRKGHLRFALEAPEGYSIIAADFSNIEARIVATLAGEVELREAFRQGRDIYAEFAAKIYGRPINKHDNKPERFVGKTCILGLGYGMGFNKFALKVAQENILLQAKDAQNIVRMYRNTYNGIPDLWRRLEWLANTHLIKKDGMFPSDIAGLIFAHERIILPNGMPLVYPGLRHKGDGLRFDARFVGAKPEDGNNIWGGMFLENVSQALARIIAVRAELRLAKRGLPVALQAHDELVWVVPTQLVDRVKAAIAIEMCAPVDFLPELPIAVEIKHGRTYGDAK